MAFSHHKFTIGAEQTAGQVTSYLADPQAAGDYYSEADHAFMRWLVTDRARAELALGDFVELAKVERLINENGSRGLETSVCCPCFSASQPTT